MSFYSIRTNLLVSAMAAIITVALQILAAEPSVIVSEETIEQLPGNTIEEKLQYFQENRVTVSRFNNLKQYVSSTDVFYSLLKRKVMPIFFAVLLSLLTVDFLHSRRSSMRSR